MYMWEIEREREREREREIQLSIVVVLIQCKCICSHVIVSNVMISGALSINHVILHFTVQFIRTLVSGSVYTVL